MLTISNGDANVHEDAVSVYKPYTKAFNVAARVARVTPREFEGVRRTTNVAYVQQSHVEKAAF